MATFRVLDLFCGAGGAAMGYHWAGATEIVGVDIKPQPRYPFKFVQADAMTFSLEGFDLIHASPPCQAYSVTRTLHKNVYPELIEPLRERLQSKNYVIENVPGAPLLNAVTLCGTMFQLSMYRHRLFESSFTLPAAPCPPHLARCTKVGRQPQPGEFMTLAGHFANVCLAREIMQIAWMKREELAQAIPPAYTHWIGRQFLEYRYDFAF